MQNGPMASRQNTPVQDRQWRPLRGVDQGRLNEARSQAHYALQWLGRAGTAYVPEEPDYGHTNLGWDDALDGFATHPFKGGARLGLKIPDLTLVLRRGEGTAHTQTLPLNGRSNAEVRLWLGEQLGALDLDASALDAALSYEIPSHPIATGAKYDAAGLVDGLAEVAAWFANADASLRHVHRRLTEQKFAPSPLRCWPHHFDLATLITLSARKSESGYVGAGFSPGDNHYDEPYFYVSVYPNPDGKTLPALPKLGHWHTQEFTAAIAPAHRIVATGNPMAATDDFLQAAAERAIKILN
jgi:hypothetical protein